VISGLQLTVGFSKYTEFSNYWKNYTEVDGLLDPDIYDVGFGLDRLFGLELPPGLWEV